MDQLAIARVCHEANRALQVELGEDNVSPHWEEAPAWQRESAIEGVAKAIAGASPIELHESWCDAKLRDGWRYSPVKSEDARTHPCLVDYAELPAEQQLKDDLFSVIVGALGPEQ